MGLMHTAHSFILIPIDVFAINLRRKERGKEMEIEEKTDAEHKDFKKKL